MKALPTLVLIGTSSQIESALKATINRNDNPIARILHGFGGFHAALGYIRDGQAPDFVYIDNKTCLASSDIVGGCKQLAAILAQKSPKTRVVAEDNPLVPEAIAESFRDAGIHFERTSFRNDIAVNRSHAFQ